MNIKKKLFILILFFVCSFLLACGHSDKETTDNTYVVSGFVSGLTGTLVLQNNSGDDKTITANGSFTFASALADGAAYDVTISTQPSGQTCTVSNGSGTVSGADVTNVFVSAGNLKLADTGQTTSYTSTFGEDADYTINPPSYTDNGDGTVTDNVTDLMWQQEDDNVGRAWADAGTYCDGLTLAGFSDWRLPGDVELQSIVDYGVSLPSIDTTYFPGTNSSWYWSSPTHAYYSTSAWVVEFGLGNVGSNNKTYDWYYVRCVRGGQ